MNPAHVPVLRDEFQFTRKNVQSDFFLIGQKVPHGAKCRVTRNGSHGTECRLTRNGLMPPISTDDRGE